MALIETAITLGLIVAFLAVLVYAVTKRSPSMDEVDEDVALLAPNAGYFDRKRVRASLLTSNPLDFTKSKAVRHVRLMWYIMGFYIVYLIFTWFILYTYQSLTVYTINQTMSSVGLFLVIGYLLYYAYERSGFFVLAPGWGLLAIAGPGMERSAAVPYMVPAVKEDGTPKLDKEKRPVMEEKIEMLRFRVWPVNDVYKWMSEPNSKKEGYLIIRELQTKPGFILVWPVFLVLQTLVRFRHFESPPWVQYLLQGPKTVHESYTPIYYPVAPWQPFHPKQSELEAYAKDLPRIGMVEEFARVSFMLRQSEGQNVGMARGFSKTMRLVTRSVPTRVERRERESPKE